MNYRIVKNGLEEYFVQYRSYSRIIDSVIWKHLLPDWDEAPGSYRKDRGFDSVQRAKEALDRYKLAQDRTVVMELE